MGKSSSSSYLLTCFLKLVLVLLFFKKLIFTIDYEKKNCLGLFNAQLFRDIFKKIKTKLLSSLLSKSSTIYLLNFFSHCHFSYQFQGLTFSKDFLVYKLYRLYKDRDLRKCTINLLELSKKNLMTNSQKYLESRIRMVKMLELFNY